MLTRYAAVLALLSVPVLAQEQSLSPPQQVISEQFAAFARQDATAAFVFASPMIQAMFGNAEAFGTMVQRGYPMVWQARDVRFLGPDPASGAQRVMLRGPEGRLHILRYDMLQTPAGWRINGVSLEAGNERGA